MAGVGSDVITDGLRKAVAAGRFDPERLRATARECATREVQARVEDAIGRTWGVICSAARERGMSRRSGDAVAGCLVRD